MSLITSGNGLGFEFLLKFNYKSQVHSPVDFHLGEHTWVTCTQLRKQSWVGDPSCPLPLRICFALESGNPLQYSCLKNPMDRRAWWAAVHRVAQSQTRLKRLSMHACTGEGNGNSLQHSCLENPRDGGAWWDAVYGVTQSWTWLSDLAAVTTAPWFMFSLSYMNLLLLQDISLNWATPSGLF